MKTVRWTSHARKKIGREKWTRQRLEKTLANPERVVEGAAPRKIYMRRYHDAALQTTMLLRVVAEPDAEESRRGDRLQDL